MALPDPPTLAIAVIGVPRSGKSTFIRLATGSTLALVRNPTTELASATFSLDGRSLTLIDTPGFDDAAPSSVLGVLKSISEYFSRLYSQGVKLAGVIYMHPVATPDDGDSIGGGPSQRGFRTFSKFCGDTTLRDVVIVTRAHADDDDDCFANAIDKGARMLRHDGSQASAHAILRHLLDRAPCPSVRAPSLDRPMHPPPPSVAAPVPVRTLTRTASEVRALTDQVEQHTNAFGALCREIDAASACTAAGGADTKGAAGGLLQAEAKDSLEHIERIRHDLERLVTSIATENARLEDENRQFKHAFSTQQTEAALRTRLLGEERRARELAEAERGRAEARLAEERALWEREKTGRESPDGRVARHRYGSLFACGAVVFVLVCASRFVLDGSTALLP